MGGVTPSRSISLLFLGSWLVIAAMTKTTPHSAHEYSRLGTVESLVERGTYQLDDSIFITTLDKIYRGGHFYSHQTPLLATMESPVYGLLRLSGARFNNSGRLVLTYFFALFTNGVAFALTVIVFARILALEGVARPGRYVFAVILPLGTWLLPYALVANNHGISGLLLACVIYLLLRLTRDGITMRRAIALGASLGLLVAIEVLPAVSFAPLIVLYLLTRRDMTVPLWSGFAAAVMVPIVTQSLINIRITGDVIPAGFHHELFNYPGSPFTAQELTGTPKHASASDLLGYTWRALFSTVGHFTFAPVLLLGLMAGLIDSRWWRARAPGVHLVLVAGVIASLAAALITTNQFGGAAVGFRHAVYLAPAFLVLLLPWLTMPASSHWKPLTAVAAAIASAMSMLLFAASNPWSALTLDTASMASPRAYAPVIAHLFDGTLLRP